MRLADADPRWYSEGNGRRGQGINFLCPNPGHEQCYIGCPFENPIDGGPPIEPVYNGNYWQRTGESFDTLSLTPSLDVPGHWHGFITGGELVGV